MSEQIISKRCSKCKEVKPVLKFNKDKNKKSGYRCHCKLCRKRYAQTEKGKQCQKLRLHKWYHSGKGKNWYKQYYQTEKGKNTRKVASNNFRIKHPGRIRAIHAVNHAIAAGRLSRPDALQCDYCDNQAKEYHHPSYASGRWLDVIPVCKNCHYLIHSNSLLSAL